MECSFGNNLDENNDVCGELDAIVEKLAFYLFHIESECVYYNKTIKFHPRSYCNFDRLIENNIIVISFYCENVYGDDLCRLELLRNGCAEWLIVRRFEDGMWRGQNEIQLCFECGLELDRLATMFYKKCGVDEKSDDTESYDPVVDDNDDDDDVGMMTFGLSCQGDTQVLIHKDALYFTKPFDLE